MSTDPVTDEIRRQRDDYYIDRPFGQIDEGGMPDKAAFYELMDILRLVVEELGKRSRATFVQPATRRGASMCLQFWQDIAKNGGNVGYPPRTNTILSRLYEWQAWRVKYKKQKKFEVACQDEMRRACEYSWASEILVGG